LLSRNSLTSAVRGLACRPVAASLLALVGALAGATSARAQALPAVAPGPESGQGVVTTVCGQPVPEPSKLPPNGSAPIVYLIWPCFERQGGSPFIEANTYLYYIEMKSRVSLPSAGRWVPWEESMEQVIVEDFKRLWAMNFLDDLAIEVVDYRFANGVIGKIIVYHMEERERVKIVDYEGNKKVDQNKIEDRLKEKGISIRLDSFIDQGVLRSVSGVVRELYAEEGYQFAEVRPEVKEAPGGPKLVHVTFHVTEGPKVKIRDVEFIGNEEISDGKLQGKLKENKGKGFFGFITGGGTYKEDKFADDAQAIEEYYRDEGYIMARVGQPELKVMDDSLDGQTRWVQLRIPLTEGERYRIGNFNFEGNKVVRDENLRPLFKVKEGEFYSHKKITKGFEKARELYGAGGYYEFTPFPDLQPRDMPGNGSQGPQPEAGPASASNGPPIVDVTIRIDEGEQYFVNRITFVGNTTTRDHVVRRELNLVEAGVFNTEALKNSIRRLNQLGYFKPLEGEAISVEKTPNTTNRVDVQFKLEEQNRNQLTFGAGVSQFDGFFGQLSFQTSNFLGRGETFSVTAQQGDRAKNYQLAFTEPFLFDRPMTAGIDVFVRQIRYINQFTQESAGGNLVYGFRVSNYARMFINYSYERVRVKDLNPLYKDPRVLAGNPFLQDSLLIGEGGIRVISKIGPSYVFNTVDHPIFPTSGKRYTLNMDIAGFGGNTNFVNPRAEGIWYFRLNNRTSLGFRAQAEYITPVASTKELPIFERLFLGGEYSMRGFDIRTVGPRDPATGLVLGGNKSLLFNAEYLINIAGPVRLVLFADAGQVRDQGESFGWKEDILEQISPGSLTPSPFDPFVVPNPFTSPFEIETVKVGERDAFKTSIGAEVRFFMPVLNVPFRLIFAMNPSRGGVLDNQLQPEKKFKFRFAVGSTF
jgi:outer membrane protein insertion porin family